jgi:hypothetical protein
LSSRIAATAAAANIRTGLGDGAGFTDIPAAGMSPRGTYPIQSGTPLPRGLKAQRSAGLLAARAEDCRRLSSCPAQCEWSERSALDPLRIGSLSFELLERDPRL